MSQINRCTDRRQLELPPEEIIDASQLYGSLSQGFHSALEDA
jgi:hypothetical protein